MKTPLLVLVPLAIGLFVLAQDPPRPGTQEPPVKTEGAEKPKVGVKKVVEVQDPKKGQVKKGQVKKGQQDPKKADPKTEPAKTEPAKTEPAKTDKPKAEPEKADPVPFGADPRDLAAMKSAEQMLEAERKLNKLIKAGKITGIDRYLSFDVLTAWPYEEQLEGMPKEVKALSGEKVMMSGFMLPIDEVQNIKEFLLVQSLWACCYGQPPDINGFVRCVMQGKNRTDYFFEPLKIIGEFKVEATLMDGYCVDIFQLHVESIEKVETGK